jgi:hypothetical protein
MRHWWLALVLIGAGMAQAQPQVDLCQLIKSRAPAEDVLVTFVVIGSFQHGYVAISPSCPKVTTQVSFPLGKSARSRAFYRWAFFTPMLQSGVREIQATVDFSGSELFVRRVHAYRELSKELAKTFFPLRPPREQSGLERAATRAAEAADAASPSP